MEALEGHEAVPLPSVQLVDPDPFLFCLRVGENPIPTQTFVDLAGKTIFYFRKAGVINVVRIGKGLPIFLFVSGLCSRAVVFVGI